MLAGKRSSGIAEITHWNRYIRLRGVKDQLLDASGDAIPVIRHCEIWRQIRSRMARMALEQTQFST